MKTFLTILGLMAFVVIVLIVGIPTIVAILGILAYLGAAILIVGVGYGLIWLAVNIWRLFFG